MAFTFFPVIVNTVTGLKSADPEQLLMVRAMGATRLQALHKIQFPSALPSICAGVKLAVSLAPVGAVIGEFVASNAGLGHLLIRAVGDTDTSLAFAAVTVFSIFGVLLWRAAEWIERLVLPWHPSQRETLHATRRNDLRRSPVIGRTLTLTSCIIGLPSFPAAAQTLTPVKVLLDWAWLPYHATFLVRAGEGLLQGGGPRRARSSRAAVRRPRR